MIHQLTIKNYAIIDELKLPFHPGLTVITGETGSGKSILLQALSVALGGKTSKIMVRSHEARAVVEACSSQGDFRRIIMENGRQKSFIDDEPTSLSPFRERAQFLADFHGQHEQQVILKKESHVDYLDRFGDTMNDSVQIQGIFQRVQAKRKQLMDAISSSRERKNRLELIQFQVQEIEAVQPELGEDISLDQSYRKMIHQKEILTSLQSIDKQLSQDNQSIQNQLVDVKNQIEKLVKFDEKLANLGNTLDSALISTQDASASIQDYLHQLDHDAETLSEVQERLQAIESLKRKYGGQLEIVLQRKDELIEEIASLQSTDQSIEQIKKDIFTFEKDYVKKAMSLHKKRELNAKSLGKSVMHIMEKLNMPHAKFDARIIFIESKDSFMEYQGKKVQVFAKGMDQVEFFLSANPGEQLKPLTEIASGGETSRIMLAFKSVFQKKDLVETLIFDEIDTGISGETADRVADCLKELAEERQLFCISHLPQIARKADHHLHVKKMVDRNQTFVMADYLNNLQSEAVLEQFFRIL